MSCIKMVKPKTTKSSTVATVVVPVKEPVKEQTEADRFLNQAHLFIDSVATNIATVKNKETPDAQRTPIMRELREKLVQFARAMKPYITKLGAEMENAQKQIEAKYPHDPYNFGHFSNTFIDEIRTTLEVGHLLHTELTHVTNYTQQERYDQIRSCNPKMSEESLKSILEMRIDPSETAFGGHNVPDLNYFFKESLEPCRNFMERYHMASIVQKQEFIIKSDAEVHAYMNEEKKFPTYNDEAMKLLINQMMLSTANENPVILKGVYKTDEFELKWDLWFFTSPRQLKIIFADRFRRYPQLNLSCHYTNKFQNYGSMGNEMIDLQFAYALVRGSTDVEVPKLNPSKKEE